jgi:hypothetical protein
MNPIHGKGPSLTSPVRADFLKRTLPQPTITPALRTKVLGAYHHIRAVYNFPIEDMDFGPRTHETAPGDRTGYYQAQQSFNSVVLGTVMNALLCGSMIYFGEPGTGKTTTPEVAGQVLYGLKLEEIQKATIYCHPNLTEEKMTASLNIPALMKGEKEVIWGDWALGMFRMLDEANRLPPETHSILLQAIDRRQISYAGEIIDMPFGPIFATANYMDSGNFEMTPPSMDRFGISAFTTGISPQFFDAFFLSAPELDRQSYALSLEERQQVFAEIQSIGIKQETLRFLAYIVSGLTSCTGPVGLKYFEHQKGRLGAGKSAVDFCEKGCNFQHEQVVCSQIKEKGIGRGILALRDYGRALAWLMGKTEIDNEVMAWTFKLVMAHRLAPSKKAMNGGESPLGPDIDKAELFQSNTYSFVEHLWQVALASFQVQEQLMTKYHQFFESVESGQTAEGRAKLIDDGKQLITALTGMADPAKWDMIIAVDSLIKDLQSIGG